MNKFHFSSFKRQLFLQVRARPVLFMIVAAVIFFQLASTLYVSLGNKGHQQAMIQVKEKLREADLQYKPAHNTAWAIPVGGRTKRAPQLREMLTTLTEGGALARNIFVFEDVLSRPNKLPDPDVAKVAKDFNINVVSDFVPRNLQESHDTFGIFLARHYKFMLDSLFVGLPTSHPDAKRFQPLKTGSSTVNQPSSGPVTGVDLEDEEEKKIAKVGLKHDGGVYEFVAIVEDDLVLAKDIVKYFHEMSRVMMVDPTVYCVSAHQDNAFKSTSDEPKGANLKMDGFDFRRGNHFMAPGWMTSRFIYTSVVRPMWLDSEGNYKYKNALHLRNGHWDRFFDSLVGPRDCIFPEVPRIVHEGADGFTVNKKGQLDLYSNLRLAQLSPLSNYGDLSRLTVDGYVQSIRDFIQQATVLNVPEEAVAYRHSKLVYVIPAVSDKDEQWNAVINKFYGLIGVGGYGGFEGYVKVRGIFQGITIVRWLTNMIFLVGQYSPHFPLVTQSKIHDDGIELDYAGCYNDNWSRDLPHHISHLTPATTTPRRCLSACQHLGYKYSGIQNGFECWCGNAYGAMGKAKDSECNLRCEAGSTLGATASSLLSVFSQPCGGSLRNSVYKNSKDENAHLQWQQSPDDAVFIRGQSGESCHDACKRYSKGKLQCNEQYFPLIHRSCEILRQTLGCSHCQEEEDTEKGFLTPSAVSTDSGSVCFLSKGRYHRCDSVPPPDTIRACVCA